MVHRSGIVRLDLDVCYLHRQPGKCQKICNTVIVLGVPALGIMSYFSSKVTKDLL